MIKVSWCEYTLCRRSEIIQINYEQELNKYIQDLGYKLTGRLYHSECLKKYLNH